MSVSLKDQVVVVVGASSGIGRETAILFAREGARVFASARRQERLLELQKQLQAEGLSIEVAAADASDAGQAEQIIKQAQEKLGPIDILAFSAGTNTPDRYLPKLTTDLWDMMVTANLSSAYYVTRAVLPQMRERKAGHIIFVSSISGLVPDVSGTSYQAAKRGLVGLAHGIRVEEKENGIRTCVVCPGLVETELLKKRPVKPTADVLAKALQPIDVAEVILSVAKLPPRAVVPELQVMPTYL